MTFIGLKHASDESRALGLGVGILHLCLVALTTFFAVRSSHGAQWQLMFTPFFVLDLPVALPLYPVAFVLAGPLFQASAWWLPDVVTFFVVHGLLGSAFWALVPPAVSSHRRWCAAKRRERTSAS